MYYGMCMLKGFYHLVFPISELFFVNLTRSDQSRGFKITSRVMIIRSEDAATEQAIAAGMNQLFSQWLNSNSPSIIMFNNIN